MERISGLASPQVLDAHHDVSAFECGEPALDAWLRTRALENQSSGASRTYVLCQEQRVVGYFALAAGDVSVKESPGRFRRNMPEPVPVVLLGRLAVDRSIQGKGVGRALVRDAMLRVLNAADSIGIRGILVKAISVNTPGRAGGLIV